jgi:hypothetical protein
MDDDASAVQAAWGRLCALRAFHRKSVLRGAFLWARTPINEHFLWFPQEELDPEGARAAPHAGEFYESVRGTLGRGGSFIFMQDSCR